MKFLLLIAITILSLNTSAKSEEEKTRSTQSDSAVVESTAIESTAIESTETTGTDVARPEQPSEAKADAIELLKSQLDKIQTLSGRFQQTIKDKKGEIVQEATSGSFSLKRPGYFLWESKEPYPQLVIGTPSSLKVYDPDLEQLTSYPKKPDDQNNPAQLLSGDLSSMRSAFTVHKMDSKKDVSTYHLVPIKSDTSYKEIRFVLKADEIVELICVDKLEQTTTIVFLQQSKNHPMEDEIFNFIPPEGTEIIINE